MPRPCRCVLVNRPGFVYLQLVALTLLITFALTYGPIWAAK